ncbi:MAG: single-stranded-DNA-specific exonuclease RecJ [Syntrophomonadaceae bacterium]|jgi:single-stranded-DNA-specific exonuclease|nr:single-stranded-DNA-specific exonuclease RecJ [Syntrophomonadaceae bacterium]
MRRFAVWDQPELDKEVVEQLQSELGISPVVAEVLYHRGIVGVGEARQFLWGSLSDLSDPFSIPGMEAAVERLEQAYREGEKVLIYGDYDVDGICSIAVLKECFEYLRINHDYYIPSRFAEGYGLNSAAVEKASQQGYQLIVTVDCGITSGEEVELASSLGVDVIVTDHHQPGDQIPAARAVVNPRLGAEESCRDLAGVGVAFKLVMALEQRLTSGLDVIGYLDLVALATVADVVPLQGENRILVKEGLEWLGRTRRPGLQALLEQNRLDGLRLNSWHIGFVLAPRLNAAGRMGEASAAVRLVTTRDAGEAEELARFLDEQNRRRQKMEAEVLKLARQEVAATVDLARDKIILVGGEGWHPGVVGIVASRISETYRRPAILVSWEEEIGKGSGRGVPGFDLYQMLCECGDLMLKFGGHPQAAGLTVERSHFEDLKRELNRAAQKQIGETKPGPVLRIDAEVGVDTISSELVQDLQMLEPYGEGNPRPDLVLRQGQVVSPTLVGKKSEHFKFWVEKSGTRLEAIGFGMAEFSRLEYSAHYVDLVFYPVLNTYGGDTRVVLRVRDLKPDWWPDNPLRDDREIDTRVSSQFASLVDEMRQELYSSRPVLLVYPNLRCLGRHLLSLRNTFPAAALVGLNGRQSKRQRAESMQKLLQGENRIFLTTNAFLQYYIENHSLPNNLQEIHFLWPETEVEMPDIGNQIRLVEHPLDLSLTRLQPLPEWNGLTRALVYTNRSRTVTALAERWERSAVEAGVIELERRRQMRSDFLQGDYEVLISDANFGAHIPMLSQAQHLVFADSPYGLWEAYSFISQAGDQSAEVWLAFTGDDLNFNRSYLQRVFPSFDVVRAYLEFFKEEGKAVLVIDGRMVEKLGAYLEREVDGTELKAVLHILTQLDLCQLRQHKGQLQLVFLPGARARNVIFDAPYFREGIAEKKSFTRWLEICRQVSVVI